MTEVLDFAEITIAGEEIPSLAPLAPLVPLQINALCNTDGQKTRENVLANVRLGLHEIAISEPHGFQAILVGGGPSLKDNWHEIRAGQIAGLHIFALNGAAKFLNLQGIAPDYQVLLDARAENVALIGDANAYLVASQCDPSVLAALPPERTALFHAMGSARAISTGDLIGGNTTVGLTALCLAHTMGYRFLHLYGYDSSYAENEHHAYSQSQSEAESYTIDVHTPDAFGNDRVFKTNLAMAKQAELFAAQAEALCNAGTQIMVHGTGLLPTIAAAMRRQTLAAE